MLILGKPCQNPGFLGERSVNGINQHDGITLAGIITTFEYRKIQQVGSSNAQTLNNRGRQSGIGVFQRQAQFSDAYHGAVFREFGKSGIIHIHGSPRLVALHKIIQRFKIDHATHSRKPFTEMLNGKQAAFMRLVFHTIMKQHHPALLP